MQLQVVRTTRTHLQKQKPKRKRVQNSASPLSKASKSVQADLRWEEMCFKLALESADTCTRSKITHSNSTALHQELHQALYLER